METMKLAAALIMRKELRTKTEELATRIENNAISQEGDKPLEDPNELLVQLQETNQQLIGLDTGDQSGEYDGTHGRRTDNCRRIGTT